MPNLVAASGSISAPTHRPFRVYQFVPASRLPKGLFLEAYWAEVCACQDQHSAMTIRNLLRLAMPGIRYVTAKEPPAECPDRNVYDLDGQVIEER